MVHPTPDNPRFLQAAEFQLCYRKLEWVQPAGLCKIGRQVVSTEGSTFCPGHGLLFLFLMMEQSLTRHHRHTGKNEANGSGE
jgi:hypothetical protein